MPTETNDATEVVIGEDELVALAAEAGTIVTDSDDCCDCVV